MQVNVSEVRANLSKFVSLVCHGERVIIMANKALVAGLVPSESQDKRLLGLFAEQIVVPECLNEECEQISEMFYSDPS